MSPSFSKDLGFASDPREEWVAHFLLNRGTLAISGQPFIEPETRTFFVDISNLDSALIDASVLMAQAICVCESLNDKWSFHILDLAIKQRGESTWLACSAPHHAEQWPSRRSDRTSLKEGDASIAIHGERWGLLNLSEGGCAFYCDDRSAKSWPPGQKIACTISFGQDLSLDCDIAVARIQHDLSAPDKANTLVSCQFTEASTSPLIEAALCSLRAE